MIAHQSCHGGADMHARVTGFAVLIALIAAVHAGAQTDAASHPCSLLTKEQIGAVMGTVGQSQEGDMPGKAHMRACSWGTPNGIFTLSVGRVPDPSLSTPQLLENMNSIYDALKGQGWKDEKKD